jgi:putative thioredoxin
MLSPLLERLTTEAQGAFRLAKVDVDANQNLALRYNVRSIPAVKAFREGQVAAEFTGLLPEPRLREFLRGLAPSAADLLLEKAHSLLAAQKWAAAETAFRQTLESEPGRAAARLGLLKSLLVQGRLAEAQPYLSGFPAGHQFTAAETLRPLAEALARAAAAPAGDEEPLAAAYHNALRLALRGNLPAAMDGILDVLRQDKHYRSGEPRRVMLGLLELLGEANPLTRQYRSELALILF